MKKTCLALAVIGAGSMLAPSTASSMPLRPAEISVAPMVESIQHRRGFYRHGGRYYYNGHRGYRYHRPGYRRYSGWWFPGAAFAAGAVIGGALGQVVPQVSAGPSSAHVQWCSQRYRSYDPSTDTFQPYEGPRRPCQSPY